MSDVTLNQVSTLALQLSPKEQTQLMELLAKALRDALPTSTDEAKRQDWFQFIDEMAGSLANDSIERGDQGVSEILNKID